MCPTKDVKALPAAGSAPPTAGSVAGLAKDLKKMLTERIQALGKLGGSGKQLIMKIGGAGSAPTSLAECKALESVMLCGNEFADTSVVDSTILERVEKADEERGLSTPRRARYNMQSKPQGDDGEDSDSDG